MNNNHVAYSGGPGGINHRPTPEENAYSREQHTAPTSMQTQHEGAARGNTNNYASRNGGHPTNTAMARPAGGNAGGNTHGSINYNASKSNTGNVTAPHSQNGNTGNAPRTYNSSHSNVGNAPESKTYNASHSNTSNAPAHTGGGQQHGQPGMAVKGQGVPEPAPHRKPHR